MNAMKPFSILGACGFFVAFGCVFIAGCGGATLYPVEGEVVIEDKPLAKGGVTYWPDAEKGNAFTGHAIGVVENGKYKLNTNGSNGAPPGWYKVAVGATVVVDSAKPEAIKNPIPADFRDAATTPLRIEVVANPKSGAYNLKVSGN